VSLFSLSAYFTEVVNRSPDLVGVLDRHEGGTHYERYTPRVAGLLALAVAASGVPGAELAKAISDQRGGMVKEGGVEDVANVMVFMGDGGFVEDAKRIFEEMEVKLEEGRGVGGETLTEDEDFDVSLDAELESLLKVNGGEGGDCYIFNELDEAIDNNDDDYFDDDDDDDDDNDDDDDFKFASTSTSTLTPTFSSPPSYICSPSGDPKVTPITSILNSLVKLGLWNDHEAAGRILWDSVKGVEWNDNVELLRGVIEDIAENEDVDP